MTNTHITALNVQIIILKQQIELEESNYKYAIQLGRDYTTLRHIREAIRALKERLFMIRGNLKKK